MMTIHRVPLAKSPLIGHSMLETWSALFIKPTHSKFKKNLSPTDRKGSTLNCRIETSTPHHNQRNNNDKLRGGAAFECMLGWLHVDTYHRQLHLQLPKASKLPPAKQLC